MTDADRLKEIRMRLGDVMALHPSALMVGSYYSADVTDLLAFVDERVAALDRSNEAVREARKIIKYFKAKKGRMAYGIAKSCDDWLAKYGENEDDGRG